MTDRANVKIIPPLIPAIALVIGGGMHIYFPIQLGEPGLFVPLGVIVGLISIALVLAAVRELSKAKTTFDVRKQTTSLVTGGIFHFTRNPTYLSMVMLGLAIALILNSAFMLVAAILGGGALYWFVIRHEEAYLAAIFGDQYKAYTATVRRWI